MASKVVIIGSPRPDQIPTQLMIEKLEAKGIEVVTQQEALDINKTEPLLITNSYPTFIKDFVPPLTRRERRKLKRSNK